MQETDLSSYDAVSEVGFNKVLGNENVYFGSAAHREVVKSKVNTNLNEYVQSLYKDILAATKTVITQDECVIDLFQSFRKIMMRASITTFLSDDILEQFPGLIESFYVFQDELEESIAKSTILPDWIAAPLFLNPVHKKKLELIKKLAPVVK